jgi:SAM-dependent methyltransferase
MNPQPKKTMTRRATLSGNGKLHALKTAVKQIQVEEVVHADTGLGTTYERWALNRFLLRLHDQYHFQSVLEAPGDGMTGISGINSLILGLHGAAVTTMLPYREKAEFARKVWAYHAPSANYEVREDYVEYWLPFDDDQFDLVWNFNVMVGQDNPQELLEEMKRVSRRHVLVCIPNRSNYAFWLHRLHHRVSKEPWDHGKITLMQPQPWRRMFTELDMNVEEICWLDCPLWPDIIDPAQMIKDFFPFLKNLAERASYKNRFSWNYDELPYYKPLEFYDIHQRMAKLAYFENSRLPWLKKKFAHHVCILAGKD